MSQTTSSNPGGSDTRLPSNVAVQGIYLGVAGLAFSIAIKISVAILHQIPTIGGLLIGLLLLVQLLGDLALTILWILGIIKAFQGQRWEYPYISEQGKKLFPGLA